MHACGQPSVTEGNSALSVIYHSSRIVRTVGAFEGRRPDLTAVFVSFLNAVFKSLNKDLNVSGQSTKKVQKCKFKLCHSQRLFIGQLLRHVLSVSVALGSKPSRPHLLC